MFLPLSLSLPLLSFITHAMSREQIRAVSLISILLSSCKETNPNASKINQSEKHDSIMIKAKSASFRRRAMITVKNNKQT